ncbi:LacI family DNA-binding transcriptional regulator [Sporosarcina sp. Te-1]|uniref:LacI family DNA-binding transcriptional regulator n=1 Tax=Sporosarcina sp. Te-1 TaxID=2818390 RepID=UPI001A9CBE34|nr:LacI family DNA-binding transcriptional regulator [Sporosarcina sp. Te-1]QTD40963.1 LacI family DNA-binding transcriptional regulator [Sporosarcina sp. Te-1]
MVRLKDIAEKVGVSVSTVSRVIKNDTSRNVNPEIKRKVWLAVKEMGYTPNEHARNLVQSAESVQVRTRRIGWLASPRLANENPYFSKMFIGITDTLNEAGYSLLLLQPDDLEDDALFQKTVREQEIEGILLVDPIEKETLAELKKWIPVVGMDFNYSEQNVSIVDYDREEAVHKGIAHLVSRGHRRIGFIGSEMNGDLRGEKRFKGYRKSMREFNLDVDERFMIDSRWCMDQTYRLMKELMASCSDLPSAFMCASDMLAIAAMRAVQENHLSVPEDVAFVGIDNNEMAQYAMPSLTTVAIPQYEMGVVGAKVLLNQIADQDFRLDLRTLLPTELMIRKST